jgi:hypothetical protein
VYGSVSTCAPVSHIMGRGIRDDYRSKVNREQKNGEYYYHECRKFMVKSVIYNQGA